MFRSSHSLTLLLLTLFVAVFGAAACGGDDDSDGSPGDPTATPARSASPLTPGPTISSLRAPFEEIGRETSTVRINYREDPAYALPNPQELADLPGDLAELRPDGSCPQGWTMLPRPGQGFTICHPVDWTPDAMGYITGGAEDRWWAGGLFKRDEALEDLVHISMYATPHFTKPFPYINHCDGETYRFEAGDFAGAVCPSSTDIQGNETEMIAYHVQFTDLDLFINVVVHGGATDELRRAALRIVRTLQLREPTGLVG